ncbi:MAG: hypothetical protein ACXQS8_09810 [Candidatus Helarchaeales archaeon]
MPSKNKNLLDFLKEPVPPREISLPKKSRIKDVFINSDEKDLYLHVKENGLKQLICKINKNQFLKIQALGMELSPQKLKEILPNVEEKNLLLICEALIGLMRKKKETRRSLF